MKRSNEIPNRDFGRASSVMSSLLMVVLFLITFLTTTLFLSSKRVVVEKSDDNLLTVDLAIFQEEIVAPSTPPKKEVQPKPVEQKLVALTETAETIVILDEPEEVIEEVAEELVKEVVEQSKTEVVDTESLQAVEAVASIAVVDRNLIVSQLIALINQKKVYSRRAQQRGVEGIITVQITLSERCVIVGYTVINSDHSLLESSIKSTMDKIIGVDISEEQAQESLIIIIPVEFELI